MINEILEQYPEILEAVDQAVIEAEQDGDECDDTALAEAIFWYCTEYYNGQGDWRYSLQCEVSDIFTPSSMHGNSFDAYQDNWTSETVFRMLVYQLEGDQALDSWEKERVEYLADN